MCRSIHRRHGRTYFLATRLLPRERRPHVWALYALARVSDDLVDLPGPGPHSDGSDPAETLPAWRDLALSVLAAAEAPPRGTHPVLVAAWHSRRALALRLGLFEEFFASMLMDLTVTRYATHEDLRRYMVGSACSIGEMMAPLLGAPAEALPQARALGEAFQLTNFIRDVAEDLDRGRVYLPLCDLTSHGVSVDDLMNARATGRSDPRVRALVAAEIDHTLAVYDVARPGLELVDARSRPCVQLAFTLYRQILTEIAARGYEVFAGRVSVSRGRRTVAVGQVLTGSRFGL